MKGPEDINVETQVQTNADGMEVREGIELG
jgi:hypothetical protein